MSGFVSCCVGLSRYKIIKKSQFRLSRVSFQKRKTNSKPNFHSVQLSLSLRRSLRSASPSLCSIASSLRHFLSSPHPLCGMFSSIVSIFLFSSFLPVNFLFILSLNFNSVFIVQRSSQAIFSCSYISSTETLVYMYFIWMSCFSLLLWFCCHLSLLLVYYCWMSC